MCVAIVKPKGKNITKKTLQEAWETNPHGAGLVFAHKGKLNAFKSMNEKEFIDTCLKLVKAYDENFLIHFRIATQGEINLENAHPFFVNKNLAFIHNGIIPNMPFDDDISDTRFFNMDILQQLPYKMNNKTHDKMIASAIGSSKLAFINHKGKFNIINERLGSWKAGVWFSNLNHCSASNYGALGSFKFNGMTWENFLEEKEGK